MSTHILEPSSGRLCKTCLHLINPSKLSLQCEKVEATANSAGETVCLIQFAPSNDETCNYYEKKLF